MIQQSDYQASLQLSREAKFTLKFRPRVEGLHTPLFACPAEPECHIALQTREITGMPWILNDVELL